MAKQPKHDILTGDTGKYPDDGNGWIYLHCRTCNDFMCASSHPSFEAWGAAVADFNERHPHTKVHESRWAQ